ncbi:MPN domain-containing protein CG4751-like isoform X1 [Diorhabda sublineata]|uniref:MPN domain-containing protein CG4751-like isoform X1 n=3 Tax=Diorhabda sublineata TaxID=1163346 RepID=UPI0024E16CAF|nr:MPN domain-containing protein CG4751-like isoform X1 [Diorhabda sublineata]
MQSQLEAALLGQTSQSNNQDVDENKDNNSQGKENEETEEIEKSGMRVNGRIKSPSIQTDKESVEAAKIQPIKPPAPPVFGRESNNRTVTLQNLLSAGILQPGPGAMTIEYLGQKFVGDLLEDGKIRSQETNTVFASPSAWAIACKRFINPDKKSGCGWASVKYRGKKLDAFKNVWYKKKKEEDEKQEKLMKEKEAANMEQLLQRSMMNSMMYQRMVLKHNTITNRTITHDTNTMIECVPFSNLGKLQPFLITMTTNSAFLMDFHCHLTKSEVSGYLAGSWEPSTQNLYVKRAFPCRCTKKDRTNSRYVETEIKRTMEREKLSLVGWYHSHPTAAAAPTLRDIDAQLEYQIKMKGVKDNSYTPCIGVIISPYNYDTPSLESSIVAYWVVPPPESKPNEYGRPMLMSYSVIQDSVVSPHIKDEMKKCIEYYKKETDYINFTDVYMGTTCYVDKLRTTLMSKFPREESETSLWKFIKELLGLPVEEKEPLISIPTVSKPSQFFHTFTPPPSNYMLPSDISSMLYNSGKFPTATSLLGLPDPMAHSTLAANNMFLQSNYFKMQDMFKSFSSEAHLPPPPVPPPQRMRSDKAHPTSSATLGAPSTSSPKLPSETRTKKNHYHKSKREYPQHEFTMPKIPKEGFSMTDYISSLGKATVTKPEFLMPDLSSINKHLNEFSLSMGRKKDYGEKPSKIPKLNYSSGTLDLSFTKKPPTSSFISDVPTDLTVSTSKRVNEGESKPLNLSAG